MVIGAGEYHLDPSTRDHTASSPLSIEGSSGLLVAQGLRKAGIACTVFEQDASLDARPRDWDFGIYCKSITSSPSHHTTTALTGLIGAQSPLGECLPRDLNDLLLTCQVDDHTPCAENFMPIRSGLDGSVMKEVPAPFNLRLQRRKFIQLLSTGIDIRYGKRVAKIETTEDEVTATFEDGSQHTANLIVGAEGAHSVVRKFLLGPEKAALIPSPLVANVAIAHLTAEAALKQREVHPRYCIWFHPNGYFSWTGGTYEMQFSKPQLTDAVHDCYNKPNPEDWTFMLMQSWMQDEPIHLKGPDVLKDMKTRAMEFPEPYNSIFQAIPDGTKAWHNRLTYWPTQPWDNRNGRVTLAGDAAHPMTFRKCRLRPPLIPSSSSLTTMK